MATEIKSIFSEVRESLKLVRKNMLSYFLATLGLVVIMAILIAAVVVPIVLFIGGTSPTFWMEWGTNLANSLSEQPMFAVTLAAIILTPICTLFFTIFGTFFGMSKEAVEKTETHAETAFSYLRHRGIALAGAGLILSLVLALPMVMLWGVTAATIGQVTGVPAMIIAIATFLWFFFVGGILNNVFPAIVEGKGVQEAVVGSVRLARTHFERVFGTWSAIIAIALISSTPMFLATSFNVMGVMNIGYGTVIAGLVALSALLWILVLLPMVTILITRAYRIITEGSLPAGEQSSISVI